MNHFTIHQTLGKARLGTFHTVHGDFETPQFMPVGTKASVKGIDVERLHEVGAQITLVNTYHLWLRPGAELINQLGGIHGFNSWKGPVLSDSGGYQVFSLRGIRKITEEGVEFRSHLDGALKFLTPEKSLDIQQKLCVDIAMVLDECPSPHLDHQATEKSLEMTLRWAKRCLASRYRPETRVFGITQGGMYRDLRTRAAEGIGALDVDGVAIGGLSVGEPKEVMYEVLGYHVDQLPREKIHYLMGVGTPEDIVTAVREGVDIFDCVMPTRAGRFGRAFIRGEVPYINIRNSRFALDSSPLDDSCSCVCCRNYSRAYLNHLFKAGEMLGPQMLSVHNVCHYLELMRAIRLSIKEGTFESLYDKEKARWRDFQSESAPRAEG